MFKKKNIYIFIIVIFLLTGCTQKDMITVCEFEPFKLTLATKQVDRLFYIEVFHNNEFVHKEIITEIYIADKDSVDELQLVIDSFERAFSNDILNYDGISYEYELENMTLTTRVTIDYTILDLSNVNEQLITYIGGSEVFDKEYNVLYEQIINVHTKAGFTCKQNK